MKGCAVGRGQFLKSKSTDRCKQRALFLGLFLQANMDLLWPEGLRRGYSHFDAECVSRGCGQAITSRQSDELLLVATGAGDWQAQAGGSCF